MDALEEMKAIGWWTLAFAAVAVGAALVLSGRRKLRRGGGPPVDFEAQIAELNGSAVKKREFMDRAAQARESAERIQEAVKAKPKKKIVLSKGASAPAPADEMPARLKTMLREFYETPSRRPPPPDPFDEEVKYLKEFRARAAKAKAPRGKPNATRDVRG